jgi:DNA-nicking Smr family endonuclease
MARKRGRNQRGDGKTKNAAPKRIFDSPFRDLKKLIRQRPESTEKKPAPPPFPSKGTSPVAESVAPPIDDTDLLRSALVGVRPLNGASREPLAIRIAARRAAIREDAEVLAQLSDLVSGHAPFELTETEEYVEGSRVGLDPRLVTRLRRGEFSTQGHIDLHGMTQPDAKQALAEFVLDSVRKGRRAVLVVHGRGLRSPGGMPVLKHAVAQWLSHGSVGGYVLAFTTARPQDGGAGAVCVLLRRERKRGIFDVLQGTKRRD